MKFIIAFFLIFSPAVLFADPGGDGPTVPWPTGNNREGISLEDLRGDWVAYGFNSVWSIEIAPQNSGKQYAWIQIKSSALFTGRASGWMTAGERFFWGRIRMDNTHETDFVLLKDHEGTKLRLYKRSDLFIDLNLYRLK